MAARCAGRGVLGGQHDGSNRLESLTSTAKRWPVMSDASRAMRVHLPRLRVQCKLTAATRNRTRGLRLADPPTQAGFDTVISTVSLLDRGGAVDNPGAGRTRGRCSGGACPGRARRGGRPVRSVAGPARGVRCGRPVRAPSGAGRSGPARTNGRVRDVPNERLVRWYVTVGLVDPPLSRRGRVARYGRRHLLQLVAVKRRQAEGRSLAEIQAELAGATDETLAAVARVPDTLPAPEAPAAAPAPALLGAAARRRRTARPRPEGGAADVRWRGGRPGGSRRRHSPGRARARGQARARGDAVARGRGPRAGPGRRDGNPERRAAAAGGTGPPAACARSTRIGPRRAGHDH